MCTCILAGKNAAASGRVLFGANDDWDGIPGVLTHVPRGTHAAGENYTLTGGLGIPELAETCGYSYTACKYSIGNLDRGWAGGINDRGVAVAGTGVYGFKPIAWQGLGYGLEPDDVPLLILRRGQSARQAVRMIGDMIEEYGMRPSALDGSESAATFSVADADEGWVLELSPGRHWVAVRVPDDRATVRVNAFGTHDADLTDTENVMASPGLADYARAQGWWQGDDCHFDFAAAYGSETSPNPDWGPEKAAMNNRRRWRAMDLLSGKETDENKLLYLAEPDRALTKEDFIAVLSDVYEGTAYDLTETPEAGKWADPFTGNAPDYALCRRGTVSSLVSSPTGADSVLWTSIATPRMSFYMPLFADIDSLPPCTEQSEPDVPGSPSLFWENKELSFLTEREYSRRIGIVAEAKRLYEAESDAMAEKAAAEASLLPESERRAYRTAFTRERIERARALCRETKTKLKRMY